MPELIIKIKDKIAKPLNNCVICDNSDYTVKFIFDEEWEKEPLRIARFIWNKQYVDVQFTGDTCEVPIISKTNNLAIGVYAGDLRTTTPAILTCYTSILSEDVVEHSVTPSEYEEIMKLLNAQATDIAALKAVDKRIWTNLDTINKTASAAKIKAEEGVAKADDALTATRTNATNINSLTTDVNALKATDERIWTNLDTINKTASTAKIKAEEGVAKADDALARNIFTDEEKAKLASITNPIIVKGRVNTVNDLPTEAVIGWFYFVGLESASSYEEYCYSENGWEYIGLSQEGVDLSNYYTKKQVDTTVNELKAIDNSLGTRIDNVDSKASAAKVKAEEGVAKADEALSKASSNTTNINSLQTDVNSLRTDVNALKSVDESIWTNLDTINKTASAAKVKAEEGVAKADDALTKASSNTTSINSLKTDVNALKATDERIWTNLDTINRTASTAKTKAEEGVAKADDALTATRTNATNINTLKTAVAINRTTLGTQCKNLFKVTVVSQTAYGVTFTVNIDKSITVNGTATQNIYLNMGSFYFEAGKQYILNGCPSGGSETKYFLAYDGMPGHQYDVGNSSTFSVSESATKTMLLVIKSGQTISNLTFKPMLRDADITDDTYKPYKENMNERLIKNKSDIAVNKTTLGYQSKNLLKLTLTTKTVSGITFTVNDDYSITLNGTSTAIIWQEIGAVGGNNFRKEKLIFTGNPAGTGGGAGLEAWYMNSTTGNKYVSIANGNILTESDYDPSGAISYEFHINQGKTYNNVTFYPMLRYADITDDTYEPYKESVDERLIKNKSDIAINKTTLGYQCKNLLKPTSSKIRAGITYTVNSDGSVTLTGVSTTGSTYNYFSIPVTLKPGKYKVNGMPSTSSNSTYRVDLRSTESGGTVYGYGAKEFEVEFTETTTAYYMIRIDGTYKEELGGVTFYPMIRYADIIDNTYEPYKENVDERLVKNKSDIALNRTTLGMQCKNLLKNTAVTTTINGVTFTVNDDKSVTVNGTATAMAQLTVGTIVKNGNYILTGCPSGGTASTYMLSLAYHNVSGTIIYGDETGSGRTITFDSEKYVRINVRIQIDKGVTVSNKTFYPMLRDADVTDSNYEPYQPSFIDRCMLKDTAGIALGTSTSSSITIDNLASYTALWINVAGAVSGINFTTNLIVPIAYLAKSTSNSVQLAGGIPSSAYITSEGVLAAKDMNGTITAKASGNTLNLAIGDGTIGSIEVISLM